jgi:micrococcal nuclease
LFWSLVGPCLSLSAQSTPSAKTPPTTARRPSRGQQSAPQAKVVKILDGTTVVVQLDSQPTTIRLIGLDAGERGPARGPDGRPDKTSSTFLNELLGDRSVTVEYESGSPGVDRTSPTPAYLFRVPDGLFVNREVIAKGLARVDTRRPFRHLEEFRTEETKASGSHLGIWAAGASERKPLKADVREDAGGSATARAEVPEADNAPADPVFIASGSAKYHRSDCRFVAKGATSIPVAEAKRKYRPCSECRPDSARPKAAAATPAETTQAKPKKKRFQSQAEQRAKLDNSMAQPGFLPGPVVDPGGASPY